MTLSNLSIYVVFVDPHRGNNDVLHFLFLQLKFSCCMGALHVASEAPTYIIANMWRRNSRCVRAHRSIDPLVCVHLHACTVHGQSHARYVKGRKKKKTQAVNLLQEEETLHSIIYRRTLISYRRGYIYIYIYI
jgi:hypothetical protein